MAKVLIVDDDGDWAEIVAEAVTDLDHEATFATSGNSAIEMIKEADAFDIVITDTRMEDGDGIDLLTFIYDKYDAGDRARTYIHSSDSDYWPENGECIDLEKEIPEKYRGTVFKIKSGNTYDEITEFLKR